MVLRGIVNRKLLALLLVFVVTGATPVMAVKTTVSLSEAKIVAEKFVSGISAHNDFKNWKNAKVGRIVKVYNIDETESAYIMELLRNGSYVGYIVVSAKKTNYPILEFSKGKSPLMRAEDLGIKTNRIYRLGMAFYIFKEGGRYYDPNKKPVNLELIRKSVRAAVTIKKL